jgi:hypothetical protein
MNIKASLRIKIEEIPKYPRISFYGIPFTVDGSSRSSTKIIIT